MADDKNGQCGRNCWWMAVASGVLLVILMLAMTHIGLPGAIISGAIFAFLLGLFLRWAFCSGAADAVVAPQISEPAPKPVETAAPPAPKPVAQASAAPVAVASSAPVTETNTPAVKPAPKATPRPAAKPKAKASSGATKPAAAKKASKPKGSTASALDAALAKSKDAPSISAPEMLASPRNGRADDLKMIKGVGPALEKLLNEVGVWHYDQVASWKAKDIAFVDAKMARFSGRIARDEWVRQAKILAKGGTTEFSARASKGDMY